MTRPGAPIIRTPLSWLNLVRRSAGVVDGVDGLAEVVVRAGQRRHDVLSGFDLDLAVASCGLDEPTAVQIVWSSRRGSRSIEHIGSAHHDHELETLKARCRAGGSRPGSWNSTSG